MAVEVTFLTVLLRKNALNFLPPARAALARRLFAHEPDWLREDPELLATSFMAPRLVRAFGMALEHRCGLIRGRDWAVVDMATGPTFPVRWLAWQGGVGQLTGAWRLGGDAQHLVRTQTLAPGLPREPGRPRRVCTSFGRDHVDDPGAPGPRPPSWGGKNVWLVEEPLAEPGQPPCWSSIDGCRIDFETVEADIGPSSPGEAS